MINAIRKKKSTLLTGCLLYTSKLDKVMTCKYQVRSLHSKGAFLVVLWVLLMYLVCLPYCEIFNYWLLPNEKWLIAIPVSVACLSAPAAGWMADAKFGNYRVFRSGVTFLFLYSALYCLCYVFEALLWENNKILLWIRFGLSSSLFAIGGYTCLVTVLPLGLDQMPDASASNITSFIAWFVFSLYTGSWLADVSSSLRDSCLDKTLLPNYLIISTFFSTFFMSVVLISSFLFSPKWLIIEPKSPGSLKSIYQVLKFAAMHKAPINRSAFTYWEEDIPSRVDLGKSKYGGPFTTEQVEDVKTILRLLAISLPLSFVVFTVKLPIGAGSDRKAFPNWSMCLSEVTYFFTYNRSWCAMLGIIAYEFVVYPFIRNKLPSSLKRIGTVSLLITLVSFICFVIKLAHYLSHSDERITQWITDVLYDGTNGLLFQALLTSVLEFVCAQSPYNMRGLIVSFVGPLLIISDAVSSIISYYFSHEKCGRSWCPLILFSIKLLACLIGFLIFCAVARWYKKRVRDDDYSPQRVVEEVYDRYLTAATAHQFKAVNS